MPSSLSNERSRKIAQLNDDFRQTFIGGKIYVTTGLNSLGPEVVQKAFKKVRTFDRFDRDNDPYGEHDFGSITVEGQTVFWKIDYYDSDLMHGSEDPTDLKITCRVLTVMLAEEY